MTEKKQHFKTEHRFLDESGDTAFYSKGKRLIVGEDGVSLAFSIGMVGINADVGKVRSAVCKLQKQVEQDTYLNVIPSIQKKIQSKGFYFHATDDPPEVRQIFYKFIKDLDCSAEIIVARKIPSIFSRKHNSHEAEFYADVLSHLLKDKLKRGNKLVLNIAARANSTSNRNLEDALEKAIGRARKKQSDDDLKTKIVFNVQNHYAEPLLNVADYICWSVQRVFEKGETRYYDFIREKISLVVDLYDADGYRGSRNYYRRDNVLTPKNRLSPPSP